MSEDTTLDEFVEEADNHSNPTQDQCKTSRLQEYISIIKGTKPDRVINDPQSAAEPYLVVSTLTGEERKYTPDTDGPKAAPQDTLMIMDGSKSGRVYRGEDGVIGSTMAAIRPEDINPTYLRYFLESNFERLNSATKGSAVPHTDKDLLRSLEIPIYPLPEQHKIATVLSTVDKIIEKSDEVVKQLERVRNGILNELFNRGVNEVGDIRLSPEESSELYTERGQYQIPTEWDVATLQELCCEKITYGIVQAGPHIEDGIPYIKTGDITDGELNIEELSRTTQEIAEDYERSELRAGELVITIRATVGTVVQIPTELDGANLTQGTARVSPDDMIDTRFLLWAIRSNSVQSMIEARLKGTTFDEITLGQLRKVPIPYPEDIHEQKEIANILDIITNHSENEQTYLESLQRLKRGLMQDLLSGTVRTTNTNIEVPEEIA
jgi:type I restriction enzyme S subunit